MGLLMRSKRRGFADIGCTSLFISIVLMLGLGATLLEFEASTFGLVVIFIAAAVLTLAIVSRANREHPEMTHLNAKPAIPTGCKYPTQQEAGSALLLRIIQ